MKHWKHKLLVAALPVAAITVGCLAAQDDVDELLEQDAEFRSAVISRSHVTLRIADPGFDWSLNMEEAALAAAEARAMQKEAAREAADGSAILDDLILSAIIQDRVGVAFAADGEEGIDPCQIDVTMGAAALAEHAVELRSFDAESPGEFMTMNRVESAESCARGGHGYFFDADESGEMSSIALCPESCEAITESAAEGAAITMDLVILE